MAFEFGNFTILFIVEIDGAVIHAVNTLLSVLRTGKGGNPTLERHIGCYEVFHTHHYVLTALIIEQQGFPVVASDSCQTVI